MKEETPGPLSRLRVLELATNIAGPFGATLFAEFGAEVIKIEVPDIGDPARYYAPVYEKTSLTYVVLGRNKKSITLNLRETKGQELLKKLVKVSDVLIENFRPGTMEKWGLGYDDIKKVNPKIIMLRVSGFGQDGPYKNRASFDRIASAMGGITYITGYPETPPVRVGLNLCDEIAGLFTAMGALVALYYRDTSEHKQGQWIDVSLCESITRMLEGVIAEYDKLGTIRERVGNLNDVVAPADNFLSKDGKWIIFVNTSDTLYRRFIKAIECEELYDDARFTSNADRVKNRDALHDIIRPWFNSRTVAEIDKIFGESGIPYGLVYSAKDICEDPQNKFRGNIVEVEDSEIGPVKMQNVTPRLSATPGAVKSTAPKLGEHNNEIWKGLMGLTEEELAGLIKEGII